MEFTKVVLLILVLIYITIFAMETVISVHSAEQEYCEMPLKRYQLIFPSKQLGCWLAEEVTP